MIGPTRTRSEIISYLEREVAKLRRLGVPETAALHVVADQVGCTPHEIAAVLDRQ